MRHATQHPKGTDPMDYLIRTAAEWLIAGIAFASLYVLAVLACAA